MPGKNPQPQPNMKKPEHQLTPAHKTRAHPPNVKIQRRSPAKQGLRWSAAGFWRQASAPAPKSETNLASPADPGSCPANAGKTSNSDRGLIEAQGTRAKLHRRQYDVYSRVLAETIQVHGEEQLRMQGMNLNTRNLKCW